MSQAGSEHSVVRYELRESAAWIVLNRPEARNALSTQVVDGLRGSLDRAERDPAVRSIVLAGAGSMFCAGADLKMVLGQLNENGALGAFLASVGEICKQIARHPKPVIAAVHGGVIAGGFELVQACDLIVATEDATFTDGHARYGLFPAAGGAVRLVRKIGANRAKQLLFTAESWSAQRMYDAGLVNEIVPPGELERAVTELTTTIGKHSATGLAAMKRVVEQGADLYTNAALELELNACRDYATNCPDFAEGLHAFRERREPNFQR
ncbi:short chain enoyl-CoA hydratase [Amycolatopsis marina]|uniref:Short chain enoyl-CoA hydratase n=1 Tax=Amycolatopsis marina TaxID=490629 RepID=A0A1I0YJ21_9PSEU|nr:enoyl-CoA hydratase/isomerase family protein [Amycolatopsis marina]SFB13435.1 short chain enoyl-CoA hydratase [Amycolatopsis marina]